MTRRMRRNHSPAFKAKVALVKYQDVYLRAYASVSDARASIGRYLAFYNGRRPHQSLGRQTPYQA